MTKIAYLAPEIPALSATFVYEEMLGLEKLGYRIQPFSVRQPASPAKNQESLSGRVIYLYEYGFLKNCFFGFMCLPKFGAGSLKALGWLYADIIECGPFNLSTWKLVYQFLVAARLANYLKEFDCEHLHVHFAHVPAQIAMYASAMSKVPFTIMAHANDIFERGLLLKKKAQRAVKFVTISEFNLAYLESLGLPSEKLSVVRCGVSFEMHQRPDATLMKSSFRIGTLGRFVEKKGIDIFLRAIAILRDKPYDVQVSIAGDGPLKLALEQLVRELDIIDSVTFEGSLSHQKVAAWMRELDIFVLACKKDSNGDMDGIPVVLMEAMSQSVPVISTRLSGIPELVIHQQTGLLAEPGDEFDLAQQIDKLLNGNGLNERLKVNALAHVQKEFSTEVNLDRLLTAMRLKNN